MSETTSANLPRVALITGAAGGLGMAMTQELAQRGWQVAAGWHRQALSDAEGIQPVVLDVTSAESVTKAVEEVLKQWGRIDLLVNNAGLTVNQTLPQTSEEDWDRVLDVNLRGAFLCSKAVVRGMLKQRSGHIINISSFAARSGPRGQVAYAAAKAALIGFTQSLAKESGGRNVQANVILPGVLPTPMTAGLPEEVMKAFAEANALGRINEVAEVARFIANLAEMKNVSGQVFQLDSRIAPWT
ncbi:MAG: 3-oxoacyl-(acyl-carrier-protein) reductase [Verrucomicrobia bacterium]|jgi:3-oxoacyl-[acyl-carrier protein] reductase|nr:3-oxoacyl-(acyl-carrier-protein) reductase [Verrucomicrobiota bacterium]